MNNRFTKFVFENGEGITFEATVQKGRNFEISVGTKGELIIKDIDVSAITMEEHSSKNYANPPIPEGYKHIEGEWHNGFVIQRISDGSEFVWVPVEFLDANGTIDGKNFNEKFGRRNYRSNDFSEYEYHEEGSEELRNQQESVKKYGGFYISRYTISKSKNRKPQSKKGVKPWVNINFNDAKKVASRFENTDEVNSHLTYGCEYDSVLEWFVKSKARTLSEIAEDSTDWGNHRNIENSPRKVVKTGLREEWSTNKIYDFAGNVDEWTQEQNDSSYRVIRGGNFGDNGNDFPVAHRGYFNPDNGYDDTGFRVTLFIK